MSTPTLASSRFFRHPLVTSRLTATRPPIRRLAWWASIVVTLPVLAFAAPPASLDQDLNQESLAIELPEIELIRQAIQRLSSDSYVTRQLAADKILASRKSAIGPLQSLLNDPSLDIRTQARLLIRKICAEDVDRELQRLLAFVGERGSSQLPMWDTFRQHLGDDWEARQLYGELANRYRETLTAFSGDKWCNYRLPTPRQLDPTRLDRTEPLAWVLVLLVDLSRDESMPSVRKMPSVRMPVDPFRPSPWTLTTASTFNQFARYASLSSRLEATLGHPTLCPNFPETQRGHGKLAQDGFKRLISAWVHDGRALVSPQNRLAIAMRYECFDQAQSLCESILNRPWSEPQSITLSLLAAATLDHPKLPDYLQRFEVDQRVAHHFQFVGTPADFVNTQVRDVVMALRLRQSGIDPRDAGFRQLQADPTYVYSPISLGFSSDLQRRRCHEDATLMIHSR